MLKALILYLVTAMTTWAPLRQQVARGEPLEHAQARYESIARDIATVVLDDSPSNTPRTALLVASLAFWESGYWVDVDEGRCRRDLGAWCDNNRAATLWQIHADDEGGIVLLDDGKFTFGRQRPAASVVLHSDDLLADRKVAVHVVVAMIRTAGVGLWTPGRRARDLAASYWQKHAFVTP